MKFIHIADVHLGMVPDVNYLWGQQRSRDIWESFGKIINICNEEKADFLFISGDLFHRQPLFRELREVNYLFSKLNRTKAVLMAGNHDYISEDSCYEDFKWSDNVYFLDSEEICSWYIKEYNTKIYGLSYYQRDIYEEKYKNIFPDKEGMYHILIAHGGDKRNIPIDKKNLNSLGFDYIALGHIHKPERIGERAVYAGSLEPLDITETGEHGYILGELSEKGEFRISFMPMSKCRYYTEIIETDTETTFGKIKDIISQVIECKGKHNIYRFILKGIRNPGTEFDIEELKKMGRILDIENETVPDYDFEELLIENRNNIIGMFIEEVMKSGTDDRIADKALYYGIEALTGAGEWSNGD